MQVSGTRQRKGNKKSPQEGGSSKKVAAEDDNHIDVENFNSIALHHRKSIVHRMKLSFGMGLENFEVKLDQDAQHVVDLLALTKYELFELKLKFELFDENKSGEIDYEEFLKMMNIDNGSVLAEALFKLIDIDNSGNIGFSEFVRILSTYCMFTRDQILRFAFDAFDTDGSGSLDEKEFKNMCTSINSGMPMYPGNFKKALGEFDTNGDGLIDFKEFRILSERYPMLVHPAFVLQDIMQKKTLGENTWKDILKHRRRTLLLTKYQVNNQGALPEESFCEKVNRNLFGSRTAHEYKDLS